MQLYLYPEMRQHFPATCALFRDQILVNFEAIAQKQSLFNVHAINLMKYLAHQIDSQAKVLQVILYTVLVQAFYFAEHELASIYIQTITWNVYVL